MAAAVSQMSEEHCLCPVCLDVFSRPVSLPCGHNFCRDCILRCWQCARLPQCPVCKQRFPQRPELRVNTFISEVASQFRGGCGPEDDRQRSALSGEVACDVCPAKRVKALKSCLDCLASYCETHLEPHHVLETFKTHRLIPPSMSMQDRVCRTHQRLLDAFCTADRAPVCPDCLRSDHRAHPLVTLEAASREKRGELGEGGARVQQLLRARQEEVSKVRAAVGAARENAAREVQESERVFSALQACIEAGRAEALEVIEARRRQAERRAEALLQELEENIQALRKRSGELEQLSHSEDHLHVLRTAPRLLTPPEALLDPRGSEGSVEYVGTLRRAVRRTGARVEEVLKAEVGRLGRDEFRRVRLWAEDVTLDPDTAHPKLQLSADGRRVLHGDRVLHAHDEPGRFYPGVSVLGREPRAGRFYYEVQVKGKTEWDVGVCLGSVNRKGGSMLNPEVGFWTLGRRAGGEHWALASPPVLLPLPEDPRTVGVFVDLEAGQVSFYDAERCAHIYSFTGASFGEPLRPYFNPRRNHGGANAAPLVIRPVCPPAAEPSQRP